MATDWAEGFYKMQYMLNRDLRALRLVVGFCVPSDDLNDPTVTPFYCHCRLRGDPSIISCTDTFKLHWGDSATRIKIEVVVEVPHYGWPCPLLTL